MNASTSTMTKTAIATALLGACALACGQSAGADSTSSAAAETRGSIDDSGWCHDDMTATDSTSLAFDYQVAMSNTEVDDQPVWIGTAGPAWLNVQNANFTGEEEVDVTVIDSTYSAKFHFEGQYQQAGAQVVHLSWDSSSHRFTGQPSTLTTYKLVEGDDDATAHRYEFAIEVNGTWLTDPISGTHNFRFIPNDQEEGACTGSEISPT